MNKQGDRDRLESGALRFYGRRQGRRLRSTRQHLIDAYLPLIRVPLPDGGRMLDPRTLFEADIGEIWLEIGFGAGEHLAAQASRHPSIGLIGCEAYLNGIAALLPRLAAANLDNVRVFDDDARGLVGSIADASLARVYVLFPDPWPKARHRNRRLISPGIVGELARILRLGGELRIASDHPGYVRWILEHVTRDPSFAWMARSRSEWRIRPADAFETRYEQKALDRGAECTYLNFLRKGPE